MGRNVDTHIRVSEDNWSRLNRRKRPGDSFNDVIGRLLDAEEGGDSESGNEHPTQSVLAD